jgi:hypothetical protein
VCPERRARRKPLLDLECGSGTQRNRDKYMKSLGFLCVVVLALVGCSDSLRNKPVVLDKSQIDIPQMNAFLQGPVGTTNWNWTCFLARPREGDPIKWSSVLCNRPILITDGRNVLATGQMVSVLVLGGNEFLALGIRFPTPSMVDDLEKKLGIQRVEIPPAPLGTSVGSADAFPKFKPK